MANKNSTTTGEMVVVGVLAAVFVTVVCQVVDVVEHLGLWRALALPGAVGTVVAFGACVLLGHPVRTIVHRTASWALPFAWLTWVEWSGFTAWRSALHLGIGAGLAISLPLLARPCRPPEQPADPEVHQPRSISKLAAAWERRITTAAKVPVHITEIERWDNDGGYTIHLDFPGESPNGWEDLTAHTKRLANMAKLDHGCTVRAMEGGRQGEGRLKVMTHNFLDDVWLLEEDWSPASILTDFVYAYEPDGVPVLANVRQNAVVIAGKRGSGKTTLEHRMIAWFARCTDAVVWVIDLNGGGIAWPWIDQYAKGNATVPTIDAVAANLEQAIEMAEAAVRIAKARKEAYAPLRISRNADLLPVSPQIPELILVVDEGGETTKKSARLSEALCEVMRIGRAEAVNEVASVLRATGDLLPKDILVNAGVKAAMRMDGDAEYAHLLGWDRGLRAADLRGRGTAYTYRDDIDQAPTQIKTVLIRPDQIGRCAIATAHLRPALDQVSVAAAGEWYRRRWEPHHSMVEALRSGDVSQIVERLERGQMPAVAPQPASATPVPAAPSPVAVPGSAKEEMLRILGELPAAPAKTTAAQPSAPVAPQPAQSTVDTVDLADPAAVDREAARLLTAAGLSDSQRQAADRETIERVPARRLTTRDHIVTVLEEAYPAEISAAQVVKRLAERGVKVSDQRVYELLPKMATAGEIDRGDGGYSASRRD